MKFQFGTSSYSNHGGVRKLPYVFTEQGVAMLATVIRSSVASNMSVSIMRAFVMMRKYISTNLLEQKYINNQVLENRDRINTLENSFKKFEEKRKISELYFNGQIYDAYSKIQEIFNEAKKNIIVIDAYSDNDVLDSLLNKIKSVIKKQLN